MKFGCWTKIANICILKRNKYNFIELSMKDILPNGKQDNFEAIKKKVKTLNFRVDVLNRFISEDLKLVGEKLDDRKIEEFVKIAIARAGEIGVKVIVFGSGSARNLPDDFPKETAMKQLREFLVMVADLAKPKNITIAIEPLNHEESNIINTVREAMKLAETVSRDNVKIMADLWHLEKEHEDYETLLEVKDYLVHIHVADTKRLYPGSGHFNYQSFFRVLKRINYNGRITVECKFNNFKREVRKSLQLLRNVWQSV